MNLGFFIYFHSFSRTLLLSHSGSFKKNTFFKVWLGWGQTQDLLLIFSHFTVKAQWLLQDKTQFFKFAQALGSKLRIFCLFS
jgi:hypothetical protein